MGQRGPAPKPTAIKKVEGNPGKRKLNTREPQPTPGIPECPDHLDEIAKKEWKRICPMLLAMRVLTEADYIALATLCQAYGTMIDAQRRMNVSGILYKTDSGYIQPSPLLSIIKGQQQVVTTMLKEFGLTPSSRSRIQVAEDPKPTNKFAALEAAAERLKVN